MNLLTVDATKSLEEKCEKWLQNQNVRFIKIINKLGTPVAGKFKPGITPHLKDEKIRAMYMKLMLELTMRKEFDDTLGELDYIVAKRQKVTMLSIPIHNYLIIVSLETHADAKSTAEKIIEDFDGCFQKVGD